MRRRKTGARLSGGEGVRVWAAALLIALAILAAPFLDRWAEQLIQPEQAPREEPATGDAARLAEEIRLLKKELAELRDEVATLRERGFERDEELSRILGETREETDEPLVGEGDEFAQVMLLTGRRSVNIGVDHLSPSRLLATFGPPREELGEACEPVTNETLQANLATEDVGPVRATLLRPALDSLRSVFETVREYEPVLYEKITSAGSLCARSIRGQSSAVSNHAFGAAIDLNIDGYLDTLGDGKTQFGLILLAEFFNEAGWYWGASFQREDSMHFEVGQSLFEEWLQEGELIIR